jgi:DNA-binding protein HU-beta
MGKSELFSHFAERFEMKRTQAREFFDALSELAEKELKRSGEFVLPGVVKLVVQKRKARMGRNPATGEAIKIPGEDRRQGAHHEAAEGHRPAEEVAPSAVRPIGLRFPGVS